MDTTIAPAPSTLRVLDLRRELEGLSRPIAEVPRRRHEFAELCFGFERSGGLIEGDQVAALMRSTASQPISQLARWIVAHEVVSLEWQARTWLPMFQFDLGRSTLRPGVSTVLRELGGVLDDWELALWFARSNTSLGGICPADALVHDSTAVWQTARLDRYITTGG